MTPRVPTLPLPRILESLRRIAAAVEAAVVMDRAGRVLAASCPKNRSPSAIASACHRVLQAMAGEAFSQEPLFRIDIRSRRASTILVPAGDSAVLAVVARTSTPESLALELSRVADEVRAAMSAAALPS